MNALEEYFLPPDDEEDSFYSDSFYLFETEADSVVSIRYQANNFNDMLMKYQKLSKMSLSGRVIMGMADASRSWWMENLSLQPMICNWC